MRGPQSAATPTTRPPLTDGASLSLTATTRPPLTDGASLSQAAAPRTSPDFGFPGQRFLHHRGGGGSGRCGRNVVVAARLQPFHFTHKIVVAVKTAVKGVVEAALFDQTLYIVAKQGRADQAASGCKGRNPRQDGQGQTTKQKAEKARKKG